MVRLQQVLVMLGGIAVAGIMVALGIWQLGVYQSSASARAEQRASEAPVPLTQVAQPGAKITEGLGHAVTFTGSYDASLQEAIPLADTPGRYRVLTGFRLDDGRLLAVVRGISTAAPGPPPPSGHLDQVGVLLPSENSADPATSVRVPLLAQEWPGQLIDGYVNLSYDLSAAQGLDPSPLNLPSAPGRLRNGAYALQWWLFAGFALVLAGRIARDLERGRDQDLVAEESAALSPPAPVAVDQSGGGPQSSSSGDSGIGEAGHTDSEEHSSAT